MDPPNWKRRYRRALHGLSSLKIAVFSSMFRTHRRDRYLLQNDQPVGLVKPALRGLYNPHPTIAADRDLCTLHCRKARILATLVCGRPGISRRVCWARPNSDQPDWGRPRKRKSSRPPRVPAKQSESATIQISRRPNRFLLALTSYQHASR